MLHCNYNPPMNSPIRCLALALLLWPFSVAAQEPDSPAADEAAAVAATAGTPALPGEERVSIDEIRRFVSVFRAVKQAYVEPIDDATLMQAAIRGLLTDLDPHSAYLDKAQSQDLSEFTTGAYNGLGLDVFQNPDRTLTVIAPIDDTPAAKAGIRPGDVIVEIDGKPITADNVDAAAESMRGAPGTEIRMTIVREGRVEPLKLTLVRETIRVSSVRVRGLESGFGYLRISTFQADTGQESQRKLATLITKGAPLQGLVLDLRSNPGGLLHAAVEVADAFLDSGMIVSTRGRLPNSTSEFRAHRGDMLKGAPIVILADAGTASAAEVLAAALRDHRRALVMGASSFGKASVQTVLPLDNGDALKLTTARYYTPKGISIQAAGIKPDIELPENLRLQSADSLPTVRERDLPGHLVGESETSPATVDASESADDDTLKDDLAVREALSVLKGLALFRDAKRG